MTGLVLREFVQLVNNVPRPVPHLTLQIYRIIQSRWLTQADAGAILGNKQPHVSALMRNRSGNFSAERLMDF